MYTNIYINIQEFFDPNDLKKLTLAILIQCSKIILQYYVISYHANAIYIIKINTQKISKITYPEAPSFKRLSLDKRTRTSLKTSLNSPGGEWRMKSDAMRT